MKTTVLGNSEISSFFRQTHYLLHAGIAPADCMEVLISDDNEERLRKTITTIRDACLQGYRFGDALSDSTAFPDYVVSMVRLGEESGHLAEITEALADYYDREEAISESIKDAVRYPLVMIGMMFVIMMVLIVKVMPLFNQVFAQLGTQMTGFARSLLGISDLITRYFFVFWGLLLALVILLILSFTNQRIKTSVKRLLSVIPAVRSFGTSLSAGGFASGMSLALSSGLDTYEGLDLIMNIVENKELEAKIAVCKEKLSSGEPFPDALREADIFSAFYNHMVLIGFKSGSIDSVMAQIADSYERDTEQLMRSLLAAIEPTLVIILSLFVGLILMSVILPLMGIMSVIG